MVLWIGGERLVPSKMHESPLVNKPTTCWMFENRISIECSDIRYDFLANNCAWTQVVLTIFRLCRPECACVLSSLNVWLWGVCLLFRALLSGYGTFVSLSSVDLAFVDSYYLCADAIRPYQLIYTPNILMYIRTEKVWFFRVVRVSAHSAGRQIQFPSKSCIVHSSSFTAFTSLLKLRGPSMHQMQ